MKKSVWIFLFAVLLPSVVLGWLALRSAEEQQIVFERRTAELYQKETEALAVTVRDAVDAERRVFGETVHRLLAKGDAEALARDFTNTLTDAWQVKAVGFAINRDGKLVSPSVAAASKKPELQRFLLGNGGFLTSTEPAIVYNLAGDNNAYRNLKSEQSRSKSSMAQNASNAPPPITNTASAGKDGAQIPEGATASNEFVALGNSGGAFGNGALILGNQAKVSGGLAGVEQLVTQTSANTGSALSLGPTNTIVLSGGVQINCQVPANVSAFDFTSMMSAPDPRNVAGNLNGFLQAGSAPGGTTALSFVPQKIPDLQVQERPILFSSASEPSAPFPLPMPANGPAATAAAPLGPSASASSKLLQDREEMPVPALKPEVQDAPARAQDAKNKTRSIGQDSAAPKMKSAQPTDGNDFAKKTAGTSGDINSEGAAFSKAMPAKPADKDRANAATAIASQAPGAVRRIELKPSETMRGREELQPTPATPPAFPTEAAPASKAMKSVAKNFPAPKPQRVAAPMPVQAPRKSDVTQNVQKTDEPFADPSVLTKSGAGVIALSNAINRQVEPQQLLGAQSAALSAIMPEEAEFRSLTEEGDDGLVARFVQDKLNLIFWVRPPEAPEMVFGCLVEAGHFSELWKDVLERHHSSSRGGRAALESKPEFVLALLDDRGKPVATQPADAPARDWKHPFVASEIGEALPHWEAALYLASPTALAESARGLWRTLAFTIAGAVALIGFGGWLVVADARRQLALAQQKTDFVSNVSHELKTPLTSIRMFAELMHDRPQPPEKQGQYLRIITVEAERLTRLINNVLDFAKIGRKQKRIEKKPLDLHALVARVWESQELHLREDGFTTKWGSAPGPYPVLGDDDALSQVLVNLLSNAEKYANGNKEVELHTWLDDGWVNVSVLDRGMGVPDGDEKKIFEAFYRAHDSLASGIQGSGLGLTLAQRIAREHGGEIKLEHREGGGSRFTLRLPLAKTV